MICLTNKHLHEIAKLSGLFVENNYFFDEYGGNIKVIETISEEGYVMEIHPDGSINCIEKYDRCPINYNGIEIYKYILTIDEEN